MGCANVKVASEHVRQHAAFNIEQNKSFSECYRLGMKLGEGAFSQVRKAAPKAVPKDQLTDSQLVAVKIIDLRLTSNHASQGRVLDKNQLRLARDEAYLTSTVSKGQNCVKFIECFLEDCMYFMIMEACSTSLMDKLKSDRGLTRDVLPDVFRQMVSGIAHVHECGIVHRDVKPDNYLYGADGVTIKLCDLGLAELLPAGGKAVGVFGTAPYMSPEMLHRKPYGFNTDVWSFGCCAYLMAKGRFPYMPAVQSAAAMKESIASGHPEPEFGSSSLGMLLRDILKRKPEHRYSSATLLQHQFLQPQEATVAVEMGDGIQEPLHSVIVRADENAEKMKAPKDPTVQRNLDDVLSRLLDHSCMHLSAFSESNNIIDLKAAANADGTADGDHAAKNLCVEDRICRKRSEKRYGTHAGTTTLSLSNLPTDCSDDDDDDNPTQDGACVEAR
eukprot:TRINITY_DN37151_c0_g1_i1.p1 TRINITY_DN37151_c0_g1~~TRINITY_DN37151_c0_g1_i1.p1  ORF type:complete len:444 (-),score=37.80 TRINITY_DN37151_c0_g1_i1:405-1736(-)